MECLRPQITLQSYYYYFYEFLLFLLGEQSKRSEEPPPTHRFMKEIRHLIRAPPHAHHGGGSNRTVCQIDNLLHRFITPDDD